MPTNKRITDLTDFTSVLPYASELFGVYQPMIGWRSERRKKRFSLGQDQNRGSLLQQLARNFRGVAQLHGAIASPIEVSTNPCALIASIDIGTLTSIRLREFIDIQSILSANSFTIESFMNIEPGSLLPAAIAAQLPENSPPEEEAWNTFVNTERLTAALTDIAKIFSDLFFFECSNVGKVLGTTPDQQKFLADLKISFNLWMERESATAGALLALADQKLFSQLELIFYVRPAIDAESTNAQIAELVNSDDPFLAFDPKRDIKNVSLSPLGIVHLFRQYFFELDTFLGSPTGHIWLSPGSTVELIEVSTRRVFTEQTIEQSTEITRKTESSNTDRDEISEGVKEDNKTDLKLGASLTVNQSWGTGNATATGSFNMDTTQQTARETTHKRMREQTEKLSSEIRQNYKSTFKTITETTDTSSKRYVLNNATPDLINYELRRKMRQVGVQVQDIGTYLCWETFVDEPGLILGLADLVNIAKPADLAPPPDQSEILPPPDKAVPFTTNLTWNFGNHRQFNRPDGYLPINNGVPVPPAPDGYEVKFPDSVFDVYQVSGTGEDFSGVWAFKGKLIGSSLISVGPFIEHDGVEWNKTINWVVGGVVIFKPNLAKLNEIKAANAARVAAGKIATAENERKTREVFVNAARQRIEQAGGIVARKYEDLREEERIIVYRKLISTLMSDALYGLPESVTNDRTRHVVSELINSIFDIDKMLYFVAPEWWKPRKHYHQGLANASHDKIFEGNLTNWSDLEQRDDNYFVTDKSQPAKMGSSLGWLLQLDGDDLRNAFLNAPWVKAVIPIRPGKELEASNWLQQVGVEGTDGLGDSYQAPAAELEKIRTALGIEDVTIADAIRFLCAEVALKYSESLKVGRFPKEEINDDNRVSATPVDKVYEHGFFPLKGGFRAITSENYEVFDQWIEVLPTDQVVPVPVVYDPKTGRQVLSIANRPKSVASRKRRSTTTRG
jgi:hypothetical protein